MSKFSFSNEFYNSCDNQFNPYNFTPNSYGYSNNNYCTNNSGFAQQNFQNENRPLTLEEKLDLMLEQVKTFVDLRNNSSRGFQYNQNMNSLQNSNGFDYNPYQFNFQFQNESQIQNENVNHFSNDFGYGNNFNHDGDFNNSHCTNNPDFKPQNFQNDEQSSISENRFESLLELSIQQNQAMNDFCNNSSQGFQSNQNLNSLPNSNGFDYNPCQTNFELQNEFQIQNGSVNNFSNDFGNGCNFSCDAVDNFLSQQF